ncbi:MAG: histidinol dehydrogenase, partial [Hyphomicrobiaceae bacterium]|nr:histidinol dehydrogenase [Hyphomicrobiaceae bacterium]
MVMLLDSAASDFEKRFSDLLAAKREVSEDVDAAVRAIIDDVCARGDDALIELTRRFDHMDLAETGISVSKKEIDAALDKVDADTHKALEF